MASSSRESSPAPSDRGNGRPLFATPTTMSSVLSPSVSSSYMPTDSYFRAGSTYSRPATSSYQSTQESSTPPRLSRTLSMASRGSPEREADEEDEVESALFSDEYESSLVDDQILSELHSNLMDPVMFPRTALSEITERTEQTQSVDLTDSTESYSDYAPSRPPSFLASSPDEPGTPVVGPTSRLASRLDEFSSSGSSLSSPSLSSHTRGRSDPTSYDDIAPTSSLRHARQGSGASPVRRLAQFFEDKSSEGTSSPASSGFRSLSTTSQSPFTVTRSMPLFATPPQQSASSSYARSTTMQSLSSPTMTSSMTSRPASSATRSSGTPSFVSSGTARPGSPTKGSSAFSSRPSSPTKSASSSSRSSDSLTHYSSAQSSSTVPETPRPRPGRFSAVRNLMARFKETSPSTSVSKTTAMSSSSSSSSSASSASPSAFSRSSEGLFSIKRRQESLRRAAAAAGRQNQPTPTSVYSEGGRLFAPSSHDDRSSSEASFSSDAREESSSTASGGNGNGKKDTASEVSGSASGSGGSMYDPQAEAGSVVAPGKEPLRMGHLWYLNVHSGSPYTWVRTRAMLYPTQLVLSWIAPGGGRGVVTLDLVNCTEVRSVPSPAHHSAQNDIGSIAAREQSAQPDGDNLIEILCPFQLLYGDGVERLAAESARERVRWVGAIWDALSRATTIAAQSTRASSPPLSLRSTPSIRSERTEQTSRTSSTEGSRSTTFLPPQSEIPTIRSPSISSESFTGSGSSVSAGPAGPRFRTSTLASASIFGPRTETSSVSSRSATDSQTFMSTRSGTESQAALSPRTATDSRSVVSSRSGTESQSVVSSRSGTESQSVVSSRSGTESRSVVSGSSQQTDFRSPATQTSAMSGTPVTQSTDMRSSSSVTSDSLTEGRTPTTRTGTFRSPSAFSGPRSAMTFLSPTFTGTGTFTRSLDDSVLSSGADSFASEGRSIAPSRSSSLRRTSSMADLDREFEPLSPKSEAGSIYLSVGRAEGGPVSTSTGAQIGRGASLVFSPPPAPRRTRSRSRSPRGPRPNPPSSYESSSQSASSSELSQTAAFTTTGGPRSPSYLARSPTTEVSSYTSEELTPTQESRTETFTRTPSPRTRTQFTSSLPPPSPTPTSSGSRTPSEDYEIISEGSEDLRLRRTESGSDWTSIDRSSSFVSSVGFPSGRSRGTESLSAPSEGSYTASISSGELRRSPARRYGDRTRTLSATDTDRLTIPSTPPRQRTYSDTSDTTPTKTKYRRPSPETTPRTARSYTTASHVAPTLDRGSVYFGIESASSFTGSEVAGEEFTTASSSERGSGSTERGSRYTTASQGRSMSSGASVSSEGDYRTASIAASFFTAEDARTPSTTYRSLSTCPLHSDSFTTASECDSGVTAQCHCKRTPVPSPLPSESSVALSPLRSLTPTPMPTPSMPSPVPPPPAPVPVPVPVPVELYDPPRPRPQPRPRVPSTPSMSTISSGTSVSSVTSISSGPSVPSAPSAPSTVAVFNIPPPSPVPVSRPPPSPVPSSVRLPFQPVPSVRSLPASLPSPTSESTASLSSMSRSPSIQSVAMPDVPAASEISRPPSVVPTIPSLTPSSSLSSRRTTPRELTATVSSASYSESIETPEIASEFGEVHDAVPSPSLSYSEVSQPTPRITSERTPTPARSVSSASWTASAPSSVLRNVPVARPHPPPSPTQSPWEQSESSVYTSVVSEEEAMSTIPSVSYPDAPAGSLARAPSIRSIKSLWATETDVSFESSLLHPSPSVESVALPPTITYETTPVRLTLPTPTVSSETISLPVTPEVAASPPLPKSPSMISTVSTESTLQLQDAPRPHSPAFSTWDEASSVTPSEHTEYRTVSPSIVSSATRSLPTEIMRALPSLPPSSRRHSPAPSVVSFRSYSTRVSNRPSISSRLSTIVSESVPEEPEPEPVRAPTPALHEDVDRLVQLINNMNQRREGDSRDLASQVGRLEEELFDLSRFLRDDADQRRQRDMDLLNRRPETVVIQIPAPPPPPVRITVEPEREPEPEPIPEPEVESEPEPVIEPTPVVKPEPLPEPEPISTPEEVASSVSSPSATSTITLSDSSLSSPEEVQSTPRITAVAPSPISITPPSLLLANIPSTPTSTAETFLSSHYSEYEDLESEVPETESVETEFPEESITPSKESTVPSKPSVELANVPAVPEEPSSSPSTSSPSSASSPSSPSEPSSPASTTTSITVQARPPVSLAGLKDALNRLERQHQDLLTGQRSLAQVLDDIRRRPIYEPPEAESDHGIPQGIQHIEQLLQQVLAQCRKIRSETSESSESETRTLSEVETINSAIEEQLLRDHWKNLLQRHGMSEPTSVPPPPRPPLPDLTIADVPEKEQRPPRLPDTARPRPEEDEESIQTPRPTAPEMLLADHPVLRPKPRRQRAQSLSPTIEYMPIPPSEPEEEEVYGDEGRPTYVRPSQRPPRPAVRPPRPYRPPVHGVEVDEESVAEPVDQGPDIDMLNVINRLRQQRRGGDGYFYPGDRPSTQIQIPTGTGRPPSAPPGRRPWYSETLHTGPPLQPLAPGPITVVPPAVSLPTGQTIVAPAPQPQQPQLDVGDVREMLDLLRRNDRAQQIALDQQREVIRYLGDLNGWLERDAHDRQTDMTSLAARLDRLRDELAQRHTGGQPQFIPPFIPPGPQPVTMLPSGQQHIFTGQPVQQPQGPMPFVPPGATATVHIDSPGSPVRVVPGQQEFFTVRPGQQEPFLTARPGQQAPIFTARPGEPIPFIPPGILPPGSQLVVPPPFIPPGATGQPTQMVLPGQGTGIPIMFPPQMTGAVPVLGPDGQPIIITAPTGQPMTVVPPGIAPGQPIPFIPPGAQVVMAPTGTTAFVPQPTGGPIPFIPPQQVVQPGQPTLLPAQSTGQPVTVVQQPLGTGQPVPVVQQPQGTGIPVTIIPPTPSGQPVQPITIIQPTGGAPGQGPITVIPPPTQQPGQFTVVPPEGSVPPVQTSILTGETGRPATTILTSQPTGIPLSGVPTGVPISGQPTGVLMPSQPTGIPFMPQPTGMPFPGPGQEIFMEPGVQQPMVVRVGSRVQSPTGPAIVRVAPDVGVERRQTPPQTVIHVHTTGQQQQPQSPTIIRIASPRRASPDRIGGAQVIVQQPAPTGTTTTGYPYQQPGAVVHEGGAPIVIQQPPFLQQPTGVQPQTSGQTIIIQQPGQQVPLQTGQPQPILIGQQPVQPMPTGQTTLLTGPTAEPIVTTQPAQPIITVQPPPVIGQSGQPVVITQPGQPAYPGGQLFFPGPVPSTTTGETISSVYPQPIQQGWTGQQPLQPGHTGLPMQMVYPGQPMQPGLTGPTTLVTAPQPEGVVVLPPPVQPVGIQPIITGQPPFQTVATGQLPVQPIVTGQPTFANLPQQVLVPGQAVPQPMQILPGQVIQQPTQILPGPVLQQPTLVQPQTHVVPPMMTGAPATVIPPPPGAVVQPPITVVQPPTEHVQPVHVVTGPQLAPQPTFIPGTQTPGIMLTHPSGATGQSVLLGPGGQPYPSIVLAPQTGVQPTGQGPIYVAQPQPFVTGQPPVVVGGQPMVVGQPPTQPVVIGAQPTIPMMGVPAPGQPIAVQQPGQPFIVSAPQPGQPLVVPTGQPIMIQPGQTGQPPIMIQQPGGDAPYALQPGQQYIIGQPGMPFVQQLQPIHTGVQPIPTGVQTVYTGVQPVHTGVQPIYTGVQPIHTGVQPIYTGVDVPVTGTPYVATPFVPQVTGVTTHYTGAPTVLPQITGVQTVLSPPPGQIRPVHTGVVQQGYPSGVQTVYPSGVESVYPGGVQFVGRPGHEHVSSERPHRPQSSPRQTVIQLPPQPMPHVIRITSPHRASPRAPTPQPITVIQEPPREASPVRIIERVVETAAPTPTVLRIGREAEPVRLPEGPSVIRVGAPTPQPTQPVIPEIVRIAGAPAPTRRTPSPTVIHLESGQPAPTVPPSVIRVGTSQGARVETRVEEPPTRITVEVPPATPYPPLGTPALIRIAGVPPPPPEPIQIPRMPTPPPTTVRLEYAPPPEPVSQPAPQVIRITAPQPPAQPTPPPVFVPAPVTVATPGPMPAFIRIDASALRRPTTAVSVAPTGQTEIVVVPPGSVSDVVTEGPSEPVEPPVEVEVITPVDGGPGHLSVVVEEEPPFIPEGSVSSVHEEEEVPVVVPPSPPRTAPPTIIRLPDSGPSRAELPPAVVRVGTAFGTRPVSPTFVQLPPSKPATPAIVRIQGAPITAPPPPPTVVPSVIRITTPQVARATPIVVARAPPVPTIIAGPTPVAPPIDYPPQVELVTPTGTARPPLTVISYESGPPLVEEPPSPDRPPHTVIEAPSTTYTIPPPAMHSPPSSVVTPVPHRISTADLDRLQEQARLQDEQQRILAEQAEQRRREMIELIERRELERQMLFERQEAERQRAFEEAEAERQAAADARREELFRLAEERRAQIAEATERARAHAEVSVRDSVFSATEAIQEVIERSEKERERITAAWKGALEQSQLEKITAEEEAERLGSEAELERKQRFVEQQERIRLLEVELERQRQECAEEKRRFEEIETERYEFRRNWDEERDAAVQEQLGDITNRLQDRTMEAQRWRELDEQRIQEAEARRTEKTERMQELHDLVHSIIADREEEKRRAEEERAAAAAKPGIENILEAIMQNNAQQTAYMARMVDDMRMESERRHQETLAMVQETAHERIDFNLNHYMNDFSKALASEVRLLLREVGCLYKEKRTLQHEISDLMRFKSQHGPGGEFDPTWQGPTGRDCPIPSSEAPIPAPEVMEVSPDPHILPAEEVPVAKPATAWRTNQKRKLTKRGGQGGATPRDTVVEYAEQVAPETVLPMPMPTPMPISVHPTSVSGAKDSWASWDRETRQQPSPLGTPVPTIAVERTLFGPRSPRPGAP